MATFPSWAEDIHVTAKISGPLVTSPAVITSPADGAHFTSSPKNVSGTCPTNAAYVELIRNGVMGGSAICDNNQNFQLANDLFPGLNSLVVHVFNLTDDEGPLSAAVNVIYDVPQQLPSSHGSGQTSTPSGSISSPTTPSLVVKTEFVYRGYHLGDLVQWPIEIDGGQAPYKASVDWGDGSRTVYNQDATGAFGISHRYSKLPQQNKSFIIKVSVTDANGNQAFIQFFVLVISSVSTVPTANIFTKPVPSINNNGWLWVAWPAYGAVLVMTASYWLGEREELLMLKKKGLLKRRR